MNQAGQKGELVEVGLLATLGKGLTAPFRMQARALARALDGEAQMALGSFCTDVSIPLFAVGFYVEEPFVVFQMSAAALFFTGLSFIAGGQAILQTEESGEQTAKLFKKLNERIDAIEAGVTPVKQDTFVPAGATPESLEVPGSVRGNCLQACVASIFDLPLDQVPHFVAQQNWWGSLEAWLGERGLVPIWVPRGDVFPWNAHYLATGNSPRGPFKHVVVERNGEMVHDPHPDGTGLDGPRTGVYLFVAAT